MIKKKVKIRTRRNNPFTDTNDVEDYISKNSISFKYLNKGNYAIVYKFKTNKKIVIATKILLPGEYILKVLKSENHYWNPGQIDYLTKLSKYGLIPKIFIITTNYFIGKYINGYTLLEIKEYSQNGEITDEDYLKIDEKLDHLIYIWRELKFRHDDLHDENILVSKDLKHVYIIDPTPYGN